MFLHYMNADDTFACMIRLLSQGNSFMLQSEIAMFASRFTILGLIKKHKVSLDRKICFKEAKDQEIAVT